jgi:hypothetical protein
MRHNKSIYLLLGTGLLVGGVGLTSVAHLLLLDTPLTALGISMIILGAVCLALGKSLPAVSPETSVTFLESGMANIAALVEELGLRAKAVYLPSSLTGSGQPQALIPLHSNPELPRIGRALPHRMIAKFGSRPEDVGILVTTPGSLSATKLEGGASATSEGLEASLHYVLAGLLNLASGVRVISLNDSKIEVEVSHPRQESKNIQAYQWLGTPITSIVASIAAEAVNKPIVIQQETEEKGKSVITLEMRV